MPRLARTVVVLILVACAAIACGGTTTTSAPASSRPPSASVAPTAAHEPATAEPAGSAAPAETPPTPGSTTAPTGVPEGAAACSGSVDNRTFYESVAGEVSWAVYCAVLPGGWFVDTGNFTLHDGGRMDIAYKGPGGARFELHEGNVCTAGASACGPRDQELGKTPFGDQTADLVTLGGSGDGFAAYVAPGATPSWSATGTGIDQATFVAYLAALHRVAP